MTKASLATAAPAQPDEKPAGGTFLAMRVPAYRILWWGTLFSFLGMQMQVIARGYLAYDLTGRNTALGGVMIAFGIPQLLFGLWGGVVADRFAKRHVLILWQSAIALSSLALAIAIATGHVEYWMLLATSVVTGMSFAFIGPARQAFIADLVPEGMLGNAIVLQQANMNGTRVFGPALAGVMLATPLIGAAGVYLMTTAGFIIASLTMFKLPVGKPAHNPNRRSGLQETLDGFRYIGGNKPALILLLMTTFVVALAFPYQGFLASVVAAEFDQGAFGLGLVSSLAAVGALAATLRVASLTNHPNAWRISTLAGIGFGLSLIAFAAAPTFVVALVAITAVGALASAFQSLNNALTMMFSDRQYFGRVQALLGLSWSLFGIISLPLGMLADQIGIRATIALMGLLAIICIASLEVMARMMGVRTQLRRPEPAADPLG